MFRCLLQTLLAPLSALYLAVHRRTYQRRLRAQRRFADRYVISIGNLSAGGTGKTPVALDLAAELIRREISVMAVLRGYGGRIPDQHRHAGAKGYTPALLVAAGQAASDEIDQPVTAREAGDEAMLYARLPGLRVAVGRDRAGVIERFGGPGQAQVILLDDAFQNPSVARDHELVLLDASVPLQAMAVIPAGRFREPPEALARAHTVLLTRVDSAPVDRLAALEALVRKHAPDAAIYYSRHRPKPLELPGSVSDRAAQAADSSDSAVRFGAFCGLGNPEAFWRTLEEQSLSLVIKRAFPDHHAFSVSDLQNLEREARSKGFAKLRWITSAKDSVRLDTLPDLPGDLRARILVQEIELEILPRPGNAVDADEAKAAHRAFYDRVLPAAD